MTSALPARDDASDTAETADAPEATGPALAAALNRRFAGARAEAVLRAVIRELFPGKVAAVSSFGAESAVILDLIARVDADVPVIFLETGKHFAETLAYRDELAARLGLGDLRSIAPESAVLAARDADGELWRREPDLCCSLRKVQPLARALDGFAAWINGRKRYHGDTRSDLRLFEWAGGRIKVNPLAHWTGADVEAAFEARGLPRHPLVAEGYASIGCAPCTQRAICGAAPRGGRWAGQEKTECGIHEAPWVARLPSPPIQA